MSSNQGWIKLHRALLDWEWFSDANTSHVLMYCLLKANHKDRKYRDTLVKRGTFLTGRELISRETGCSVREVRTALKRLESANVLTSKTSSQGTVIEVLNYDRYQSIDQQNDQQATSERPANDQRATTNKNDKNDKNEKNIIPTLSEVEEYFTKTDKIGSTHITLEAENFINHYESLDWKKNGRKIKNWKLQASTWANNYVKFTKQKDNKFENPF